MDPKQFEQLVNDVIKISNQPRKCDYCDLMVERQRMYIRKTFDEPPQLIRACNQCRYHKIIDHFD